MIGARDDAGRLRGRARVRAAKSAGSSIRMWSPLIDSAFFWSKRAGFGLTFAMSNAATSSSSENTSRSAESDQPSSER